MGEGLIRAVGRFYYNMYQSFNYTDKAMIFTGGDPNSSIGRISNSLNSLATSIGDVMEPIALAIAVLFFFISLIEFAMSDRLTIESFVKFFAKLAISIACIFFCSELTSGIEQFGNAFSTFIVENANLGTSLSDGTMSLTSDVTAWEDAMVASVINSGDDLSLGKGIGLMLEAMLPYALMSLVGLVVGAILIIISFSRFLELSLRAAFMPIAVALIADDGWRGAAGRYIRKFVAICAQGALLTVLMNILQGGIPICFGWEITATGINFNNINLFVSMTYVIGFAIAVVSLMFKSIGIINDVFGA